MKFSPIAIAALAQTVVAMPAYTAPADSADGVYMVTFDEDSQGVRKRLADENWVRDNVEAPVSLTKRSVIPHYQGVCTEHDLDQNDYGSVQQCLGNYLNAATDHAQLPSGGGIVYCQTGNTVLAVCLYDQSTVVGNSGEIDDFNSVVDRDCSAWKSGYVFIREWNKTYWRGSPDEGICANLNGGLANGQKIDG